MKQLEGIEEISELTPLQQGMLFHSLYAPDSPVYTIQLCMALDGDLDEGALTAAWRAVLARHVVLRTSFVWERVEKPYQVVHRAADLNFTRHDWRGLDAEERDRRGKILLEQDRTLPFDLTRPSAMRLTLLVDAARKARLVWTFHHIILEGWSAAILLGEFWKLYGDMRSGRTPELPPAGTYMDYIRWLRRQDQTAAEAYWRDALKGFSAPTRLPIDRSPGNALAEVRKVDTCGLTLPDDLSRALKGLGRVHRLTLNTVIQGAWSILLSRYSGETDVAFGAVVAGRPADLPGAESIVGLFVNTLPARAHVDGGRQLIPWLAELQLNQAEMRQFEYSSLMQVREWSEVPGGQPLFHTALAFENWLGDLPAGQVGEDLRVSKLETQEASDQPLSLFVVAGNTLALTLMYDVDRFDNEAVQRMLAHYRALLEGIAANPDRRISELSLLGVGERERLLLEWNRTGRDYPREAGVHELFERQAARAPGAVAVDFDDARLSYAELNERANRLAHHLRGLGVGPDVLVGLCMERSGAALVAMLGILKAGGAYVPLDPEYPVERLAFMLADTGAPVVVTQSTLLAKLPEGAGARIVCLDRDAPAIDSGSAANPAGGAGGGNLAYVIYTSGSTGVPKGVQVTHRAVNRLVCNTDYVALQPADRFAQVSVMSFDAATFEIWGALLNGAQVIGVPRETSLSPRDFADFLGRRGITVLFLTTALFNQMAREAPGAFRPLRYVLFGGEAVDPGLVRTVLRDGPPENLLHVYGPTEVTTFSTWHHVGEVEEGATTVPIGRPIANTAAYVLDEQRNPVPVGITGELYLGGDGLARGYLNRAELTASHFVDHPFGSEPGARLYRTGDWVRQRRDGAIEFIGRRDNQVKIRGFRIELGELEAVLSRLPQVRDAIVVVREDEPGDKRLVAYVVAKPGARPMPDELRQHFRASLPEHMTPAVFVMLDAMPLTPNGKIDRRALPAPDAGRHLDAAYVPPGSELEIKLAEICRDILRVERVGLDDNFFDLGGNSLLLIRLHGRLRPLAGEKLRVVDLFRFPTIRMLAGRLARDEEADSGQQDRIQERAKKRREAIMMRQPNLSR